MLSASSSHKVVEEAHSVSAIRGWMSPFELRWRLRGCLTPPQCSQERLLTITGWSGWRELPCMMQEAVPDVALMLHSSLAWQRYVRGCGGTKQA